jgi:hypothetical protein
MIGRLLDRWRHPEEFPMQREYRRWLEYLEQPAHRRRRQLPRLTALAWAGALGWLALIAVLLSR